MKLIWNVQEFFLLTSLEEISLVKLSSFLIEKVISSMINPITVKNFRNVNFLFRVEHKKLTENIKRIKKILKISKLKPSPMHD